MKIALLVFAALVIGFTCGFLFGRQPTPRFVTTGSRYLMFDQKTARACYSGPKIGGAGFEMPDGLNGALPFCEDLLTGNKEAEFLNH